MPLLFWHVAWQWLVVCCWDTGTVCLSHRQGARRSRRMLLQVDAFECTGTVSVVMRWQGSKSFVIAVMSNYLMIRIILDLIKTLVSTFFSSVHLLNWYTSANMMMLNRLTPNDPYMGRTAPLTSKRCILYIYSTNIGTEYFKHALYSPFFSLQNAVCFIMLTCLVPVFTFYVQGVLKLKK